jgi:hypothetical protein
MYFGLIPSSFVTETKAIGVEQRFSAELRYFLIAL